MKHLRFVLQQRSEVKVPVKMTAIGMLLIGLAVTPPALSFFPEAQAASAAETRAATEACMDCHAKTNDTVKFKDGTKKPVQVDRDSWMNSIHGGQISCSDCHRDISGYPHPKADFQDARDFTLKQANTCQRCHYAYYTRVLDSIHYELLQAGERSAPTCVDCHGSHGVRDPKTPRTEVTSKCAKCHDQVFAQYAKSVHGRALLEQGSNDAPVCTDCHGSHAIQSLHAAQNHARAYETCGKCHGDAEKMKKYGLNPDVMSTYLDDFHGASNRLYSQAAATGKGKQSMKTIATCSDCHGIHDIQSLKAQTAGKNKQEVRERVVQACRRCHAEVKPEFADAWLSHYPATLEKAPLVWMVRMAYRVLIPLIMLGLVLHILLHLWRLKTRR